MAKKPKFQIGDIITCHVPVEARYSGYNGNPVVEFTPGTTGRIISIPPKVTLSRHPDGIRTDGHDEFLNVAFVHPQHGEQIAALNFCNAVKE